MKKTSILSAAILAAAISGASAREQIRAVGSSTVYPFITAAAEEFGDKTDYKTPIIEATGTGGGLKIFCSGIGAKTPDLSNASRPIKKSERELCAKNGVTGITEIKLGFDGIVLANSKDSADFNLTKKQIFLALAKYVPSNGYLILNPYKKWSDIDAKLPNKDIAVYGPPPTSGTRDAFLELVMQKTCVKKLPEFKVKYADIKARKKACSVLREDGGYIDAGENDNVIVHKLAKNKNALGIFGYSYLEENAAKVKAAKISGVKATFDNISSGEYPISRSLFVYVKDDHFNKVSSLKSFVKELISEDAVGDDGYLSAIGLIPLNEQELTLVRKSVLSKL